MEEPWQGIEEQYRSSIQNILLQLEHTTAVIATNDQAFARQCNKTIQLAS
jgi:ABC-type lipoprotein export system ATPase subunit